MARGRPPKSNDKPGPVIYAPPVEAPGPTLPQRLVEEGHTVVGIRNTVLQMVRVMKPRDEEKVLAGALRELEIAPELATESYYVIPYRGKGGVRHEVSGPSIGAAMTLARRWGNAATEGVIISETDDEAVCEGRFVDAETNFFCARQVRVPKEYVDADTKHSVPLTGKMLDNAIQAGVSKAQRNAILAGLPKYLARAYFDAAKKVAGRTMGTGKPVEGKAATQTAYERMVQAFGIVGVTKTAIDAFIEDRGGQCEETFGELRGIYNAIRDGQTTAKEVFGSFGPSQPEKTTGSVKTGDLL